MNSIYIILIISVIGLGIFMSIYNGNVVSEDLGNSQGKGVNLEVNEGNFIEYISSISMIKDLPRRGRVELRLFDEVEIKRVLNIENGVVKEGSLENAEVVVYLKESYVEEFSNGFCQTLQKARVNGDLRWEVKINMFILSTKYGKMLKYKDCLGL
jgi:hypothetical protein